MSTRDDDALDALIDRVAYGLTAGEAPVTLARNVRVRIGDSERGYWFGGWRPVTAVAALVLVIAVGIAVWPERSPVGPSAANNRPVAATDGPADLSAGALAKAEAGPYVREDPKTDVVAGSNRPEILVDTTAARRVSRPAVVTAVTTTDATPLPGIEPLTVGAIEDPVLVAEMSGLAVPIDIEPLQIAPLELQ